MKRTAWKLVAAAFVGGLVVPQSARAETLVVPWLAAGTGSGVAPGTINLGVSTGVTFAGLIGVDFDLGYSPEYFGRNLNSHVLTAMGNLVVGIPFDGTRGAGIRPYLTGGLGVIRARIDDPFYRYSFANTDAGMNVGGGFIGFLGTRVGVRADLRYIRSLEDETSTNLYAPYLSHLHLWRASIGLVLR
jgi:Outer membrane protein beta-barrel domain